MDFGLSDEQEQIRDEVREVVNEEIYDKSSEWDTGENFPTSAIKALGEVGVLGMNVSPDLGGMDTDPVTAGIIWEEIGRGDVGICNILMGQVVANSVLSLNEEHHDLIRKNVTGEVLLSWAVTEPDVGTDMQSLKTTAREEDGEWVISGQKAAIVGAQFADYIMVMARDVAADKIKPYIAPLDHDNIHIQPYPHIGSDYLGWSKLDFEDVRLPEENKVTDKSGFKAAVEEFDVTRGWIGLLCLGSAREALEQTEEYLKERKAFNKSIAEYQGPQFEIAEMWSNVENARMKAYESLWKAKENEVNTMDAAIAKLSGTQIAADVIHDCIILHGHKGFSQEVGLGKRLTDVIGYEIGEGATQIQKYIVARERLGNEYVHT